MRDTRRGRTWRRPRSARWTRRNDTVAKVTMPQLGESVAEGTIGKWLKQPGDTVEKYEPLLEVITDKVNAEVPSPFAGVLKEILAEEGATVPNNAEIAVIETSDDAAVDAADGPTAPATPPVALESDPASEPDGMPQVEVRDPAAVASSEPAETAQPANGPAGSDERPERAAAATPPPPSEHAPVATAAASTPAPTAVASNSTDAPG